MTQCPVGGRLGAIARMNTSSCDVKAAGLRAEKQYMWQTRQRIVRIEAASVMRICHDLVRYGIGR